jgi:glycosyltransferase involved in cell wall biosynthesis
MRVSPLLFLKVVFVTVVPSPYQRDLFAAMAQRPELELQVLYLEAASPDSPWPEKSLRPFERVLPGFWIPFGGARWFFNWRIPNVSGADFVILSSFTSWTGQYLMRGRLKGQRWLYWGERMREQSSPLKARLQCWLTGPLRRAAAIVGIGSEAQADYGRRFPGVPNFSIPYYCDLSPFVAIERPVAVATKELRSDKPGPTILFCGQMIARKGLDILLASFNQLIASGLRARLLLVGREAQLPIFLTKLSQAARSLVRYEGFQPPEKLSQYFAQADIFVLPSRHDGWGVVLNQALGAGLPLICSDAVGAAHDLVEPEVNGLIFPAGDVSELHTALRRLAVSPETAIRWGEASRRKAADWTPAAGAEKWLRVFETLELQERGFNR